MKKRLDWNMTASAHVIDDWEGGYHEKPKYIDTLRSLVDLLGGAVRVADSESGYWPDGDGEYGVVYDVGGEYIIVNDQQGVKQYIIFYGKNERGKAAWVL